MTEGAFEIKYQLLIASHSPSLDFVESSLPEGATIFSETIMKSEVFMNLQNLKEYLQILVGKTLEDVNLACEMIMFTFGNVDIHAQCFTRIIYKNNVLLTTLDYQNWDGVTDTNNDEWFNLSQNKDKLVGCIFTQVSDVEDETNGFVTYDRKVVKVDSPKFKELMRKIKE